MDNPLASAFLIYQLGISLKKQLAALKKSLTSRLTVESHALYNVFIKYSFTKPYRKQESVKNNKMLSNTG